MLLRVRFTTVEKNLPEDLRVGEVAHLSNKSFGDVRSRLQDVNHDLSHTVNTWVHCHASQDFETDLCSNVQTIHLRGVINVAFSDRLQDLKDEVKELSAVNIALESELLVVIRHFLVEIVGKLTICTLSVVDHLEVFFLLLIKLNSDSLGLVHFDLIFSHEHFDVFLDSPLVEEHVGRRAIRVT